MNQAPIQPAEPTYTLPSGQQVTKSGAEIYARALELKSRCQALVSEADIDAKIASAEAEQRERDKVQAHRARVEKARQKAAAAKEYVEKTEAERAENLAAGLVEVRVDPGKTWTLEWFEAFIAHRVPDLQPQLLDSNLGTLAILRAVDMLTERRRKGRVVANPAGFVVTEARRAMAKRGGPTTWVDQATADEKPHLIVREYAETFAGRVSARWALRQQREHDDSERAAMGLLPAWAVKRQGGEQ